MQRGVICLWSVLLIPVAACFTLAFENVIRRPVDRTADLRIAVRSELPSAAKAKAILDATHRHGEWISVPVPGGDLLNWVVYPDRADKAAVVLITAKDQKLSDWLRALADQIALEGFIAVVPDATSLMEQQVQTVRNYMLKLPMANGRDARFTLSSKIQVTVGKRADSFSLSSQAWPDAMTFLSKYTENAPPRVAYMPAHSHAGHELARPEFQAAIPGGSAPLAYPRGKLDNMPAGLYTARSTILHSPVRFEWVDIATPGVYAGKLHTRITYPQGNAKAGVVIVMQYAPGMNHWMQAVGDQLSREGFIALVADLNTGMGPNGGNYESFDGPDAVFRANARLTPQSTLAAYKVVRDYGMKLPQSNGKTASMGFCMGGANSWIFATELPDLNAAVVFYGRPPSSEAMAKIKPPVIAFYGEDDARITVTAEPTMAEMKRLGKSFEAHVYPHATHDFLEFQDIAGNPQAVTDSWSRTVAFLKQHLK